MGTLSSSCIFLLFEVAPNCELWLARRDFLDGLLQMIDCADCFAGAVCNATIYMCEAGCACADPTIHASPCSRSSQLAHDDSRCG